MEYHLLKITIQVVLDIITDVYMVLSETLPNMECKDDLWRYSCLARLECWSKNWTLPLILSKWSFYKYLFPLNNILYPKEKLSKWSGSNFFSYTFFPEISPMHTSGNCTKLIALNQKYQFAPVCHYILT